MTLTQYQVSSSPIIKITDLAAAFNITPEMIAYRRKQGWKWHFILLTPARGLYRELNSSPELKEKYKNHKVLCQKFKVPMNPDDVPDGPRETPLSYTALAKGFGIPTTTLISRMREGWGWERSLLTRKD